MITEPIKDNKELQAFLNFYADKKPNLRNHCLIVFGLNTALRISDILNIKWNMIYDFENKKFIKRLTISEHKTGKINIIPINDNLSIALQKFFFQTESSIQRLHIYKIDRPHKTAEPYSGIPHNKNLS